MLDKENPKIKHLSGQYLFLPECPEPDDILYFCFSKKKRQFGIADLIKHFGEEKKDKIDAAIKNLEFQNLIQIIGESTYKIS